MLPRMVKSQTHDKGARPSMNRRHFLYLSAAAAAASAPVLPGSASAGELTGRIHKSLKWSMVADRTASMGETFKKIKACGFEGIEPNFGEVKDAAEWKAASRDSGLAIDCVVSPSVRGIEAAVDLCKDLGGDSILVVAPYDHARSFADNYQQSLTALKAAAPHAEKQKIKILVENVWATFLISALDMAKFVDDVGSPAVGVHYDVGNVVRWGVSEHWIEVLGKRIGKLDIKEYSLPLAMKEGMSKGFGVPLGEGSINWAKVRAELKKLDFTGWAAAEVGGGTWDHLTDIAKRMDKVLGLA